MREPNGLLVGNAAWPDPTCGAALAAAQGTGGGGERSTTAMGTPADRRHRMAGWYCAWVDHESALQSSLIVMRGADEDALRREVIDPVQGALSGNDDRPEHAAWRGQEGSVALIVVEVARDRGGFGTGGLGKPVELRGPLQEVLV